MLPYIIIPEKNPSYLGPDVELLRKYMLLKLIGRVAPTE
jgi:hypothetical protein